MTYEEVCKYSEDQEIEIKVFSNPSYKNSIIGISYDNRVIYDYDLMIEELMEEEDLSFEDALEFLEYNTLRALFYMGKMLLLYFIQKSFKFLPNLTTSCQCGIISM